MKPVESLRRRATPALEWALPYWTRGKAGRETPEDLFRLLYLGWLVAFSFKVLGASWDVSWHFKWLRDDLAPPHLLNSVGTAIALALTIIHVYTGYGVDKMAQRLIAVGHGRLPGRGAAGLDQPPDQRARHHLVEPVPPDALHRHIFHDLRGDPRLVRRARPGRMRTVVLGGLFVFLFENVWFPAQHQEYGVYSIAAWDRGGRRPSRS